MSAISPDQPAGTPLTDVHAHWLPGWYREEASRAGHVVPDRMPGWPSWDMDAHLRLMDRLGIDRSLLSISSPAAQFGDIDTRRRVARRLNEEAAELVQRHPDRLTFLAALPLHTAEIGGEPGAGADALADPSLDAGLEELAHAVDELGARGALLLTRVDDVSIAGARFAPLWAELGRRKRAVLLHPTTPPGPAGSEFPAPMMEFLFDTARVVAQLTWSGRLAGEAAGAQVIVPHVGGVIPLLIERWEGVAAMTGTHPPGYTREVLASLWFDLAGTPMPVHADLLARRFGIERILYGSDYCFTPAPIVEAQLRQLDEHGIAGMLDWRHAVAQNTRRMLEARSEGDG